MTWISSQKTARRVNKAMQESYQKGKVTPLGVIMRLFNLAKNEKADEPITQPVEIKSTEDVAAQLRNTKDDIDLALENSIHASKVLGNIAIETDSFARKGMLLNKQLRSAVEKYALLKSEPTLVDAFVLDTVDSQVIDTDNTTVEIDFSSGDVHLPQTLAGTTRLKVPTPKTVEILKSPRGERAPIVTGKEVNIFNDSTSIWNYQLTSYENNKSELAITYKLWNQPELVNLITIETEGRCGARVNYSNDGQNFYQFDEHKSSIGKKVFRQDVASMSYLQVVLTLPGPDNRDKDQQTYLYNYGIRSIGLYSSGYAQSATYQTKPLTVSGGLPVDTVALAVEGTLPADTNIRTYVSANSNPLSFEEVKPSNFTSASDAPSTVKLRSSLKRSLPFIIYEDTTSTDRSLFNVQNQTTDLVLVHREPYLNSLKSNPGDRTSSYRSGSNYNKLWSISRDNLGGAATVKNPRIYKGVNAWQVQERAQQTNEQIAGLYAELTPDTELQLFRNIRETINLKDLTRTITPSRSVIDAPKLNAYGKSSIFASITSLSLIEGQTLQLKATRVGGYTYLSLPSTSSQTISLTAKKVKVGSAGYFNVEVQPSGTTLKILDNDIATVAQIVPGTTYNTIIGVENISSRVTGIENGSIILDPALPAITGKVELVYNSPLEPNEIVSINNVQVTDTGTGTVRSPGTAFTISDNGTMSIPNGSPIAFNGTAYSFHLSFEIETTALGLVQYSTWLFVTNDSVTIEYPELILNTQDGETAVISGTSGIQSLLETQELKLARGWHKLSITSNRLDLENPDLVSGLYKIIRMVDVNGASIWHPGKYFSQQRAYIDPIVPVSEFEMLYNVKTNNKTVFALDSNSNVLLNFDPARTKDVLSLSYEEAGNLIQGTKTLDKKVEYEYEYEQVISASSIDTSSIVIKCELTRNTSTEATPTINKIRVKCK